MLDIVLNHGTLREDRKERRERYSIGKETKVQLKKESSSEL